MIVFGSNSICRHIFAQTLGAGPAGAPGALLSAPSMSVMDLETVEVARSDRVAWISLNRPEALNAWTYQLGRELTVALDEAAADPEVRAIVLTGAGRAFSSGADLKSGRMLYGFVAAIKALGLRRDFTGAELNRSQRSHHVACRREDHCSRPIRD